eukprot:989172_1
MFSDDQVAVGFVSGQEKESRTEAVDDSTLYSRKCCKRDITFCCVQSWSIGRYLAIILAAIWVLFLLVMIFLPMSSVHDVIQQIFPAATALFPADGSIITPDCAFTWANVSAHFNVFLFLHWLRYFISALIWRTRFILWTLSISWEVIENCLFRVDAFQLAGHECWFDSLIFDVLLMNALGIEIGLFLVSKSKLFTEYQSKFHEILFSKQCRGGYLVFKLLITASCFILPLVEQTFAFMLFVIVFWFQSLTHWMVWFRTLGVYTLSMMYATNQVYYYVMQPYEVHKEETKYAQFKRLYFVVIVMVLILLELILCIKGYANL